MDGLTITHSSVDPTSGVSEMDAPHICPSSNALVPFTVLIKTSNNVRILCLVVFGKVGKLAAASVGLNGFGA